MEDKGDRFGLRGSYSIGFKVFFVYSTSMVLVIAIIGSLFFYRSDRVIQRQIGGFAQQTIVQAGHRLETVLRDYKERSRVVLGNRDIQDALMERTHDPFASLQTNEKIKTFLQNSQFYLQDTLNIYFIGLSGLLLRYSPLTDIQTLPSDGSQFQSTEWYKQIWLANGRTVFFGKGEPLIPNSADPEMVFTFGVAVKNIDEGFERIGIMLFEVSPTQMEDVLSEVDFNEAGNAATYLVDESDRIVVSADQSKLGERLPTLQEGEDNKPFVFFARLDTAPWRIVSILSEQALRKESHPIGWFMLQLSLLVIAISMLISYRVAKYVQGPTGLLLRHMGSAQRGNFTNFITTKRRDEFGHIFKGFNDMLMRIKALIDELYVERIIQKEMQFKVLGSQINMHFLYNTLNAIYWMAKMGKGEEIAVMVRSLSQYYQACLSEGEEEITVRRIAALLENYLAIQDVRYRNKITASIYVDERIAEHTLIPYLFQPIVENAVYHGLEPKDLPGTVKVRFEDGGEYILFVVEDDGVGMSLDKLEELRRLFEREEVVNRSGNFALKNIQAQIHLKYGAEYGVRVRSQEGAGTCVQVILPKR